MTSHKLIFLVLGVIAASLRSVRTYTDDQKQEILSKVLPHILECSKEHGVPEDALKTSKETGNFDSIQPCFIACFFKKTHLIDDEGKFDTDKAEALSKKLLPNEDDQNKAISIVKACASVNDASVSDGEKGCDRSKLLFDCMLPFREQFIKSR